MNAFSNIDFGVLVPGESIITATGTTQATAYPLRRQVTVFSTVPSGSGAILPSSYAAGTPPIAMNRGANDLLVYPATGDQIENLGVNAPYTVAAGDDATFISFDPPLARSPRQWWLITSPLGINTNPIFDSITGGDANLEITGQANGGAITIAGATGGLAGGGLSLSSGTSSAGSAGTLNVTAGNSANAFTGGAINIRTGSGAAGGALLMRTADGTGTFAGGGMTIRTGKGGTGATGNGGILSLVAGDSQATNGDGGSIGATAGNGTGSGAAGGFTLAAGTTAAGLRGPIFLNGLSNTLQLQLSGNIASTGTLAAVNAWLYMTTTLSGINNATVYSPMNLSFTDAMNGKGNVYGMRVAIAPTVGSSGIRTAILGNIDRQVASNPGAGLGSARFIAGLNGNVSNSSYQNGRMGRIVGSPNYGGQMDGGTMAAINRKGSFAHGLVAGAEINALFQAGSSGVARIAIKASTGGINNRRADYIDAAFVVGEFDATDRDDFGWHYAYTVGTPLSFFPCDTDSTIFMALPKQYAFAETATAKVGFDIQWVRLTAGGAAFLSTNHAVDDVGGVYGSVLYTTAHLQSAIATLDHVAPVDKGEYPSGAFPTFTVQDPPSGGSTATVVVATVEGARPVSMGNSGRLYTNGGTASAVGGTGAPPTWTITADGSGRITALAILTNGSWSIPPSNPVQLTDGTHTSAWINILTYTNDLPTTNTFIPATWEFAATGNGYAVGNVVSVSDDAGTPTRLTIDNVTADGGITFVQTPVQFTATTVGGLSSQSITVSAVAFGQIVPNTLFNGTGFATGSVIRSQTSGTTGGAGEYLLFGVAQTVATPATCTGSGALAFGAHVSTAGSLTATSGTFSALTNISGTGVGGTVQLVYGVSTFTYGAGTGYPAKPPPKIASSLTSYRIADLTAVMTVMANSLALNGLVAGGAVTAPNPTLTTATTQVATANFVLNTGLPVLLGSATVNLNTAGDQTITLDLRGYAHWRPVGGTTAVGSILLTAASTTATTAVGGIYTAAAKGGTALVPNTQAWSVAATTGVVLAAWQATPAATLQTVSTIYFNLTTLEGTSRTATIYIYGILLP